MANDYLPEGWVRVHSSAYTRVACNREQQLFYKEFLPRSPAESMKAAIRGSRATRARLNGDALLLAGIDAPVNVLWGKLPGSREYLFTATAPGRGVDQWLRDAPLDDSEQQLRVRRRLLRSLGTFVGRVHATGFIHGDLRPGNILAALQQGRFRFTLIDNERNLQQSPASGRRILRNLMQLNMLPPAVLSARDRMRFFRAWCRQMRHLSPTESRILGTNAYKWAMRRLYDKGQL